MLVVVFIESVPEHLRGYLDRYLNEVRSSIFVGSLSRSVAERLWKVIDEQAGEGDAFMVTPTGDEVGFRVDHKEGGSWRMQDHGGWPLPMRRREVEREFP